MKISKIYLDLWREGFRIRRMIYLYISKIEGLLIYIWEKKKSSWIIREGFTIVRK